MSTIESSSDEELRTELESFLHRNIPQIQMHGGVAQIINVDTDDGIVEIHLGGRCDGCGLAPMTIDALRSQLIQTFAEIDEVIVQTRDMDVPPQTAGILSEDDEEFDAPF